MRLGLGLFLGSHGEREKEIRTRKEKAGDDEGREQEWLKREREKEERWIEKGKIWLDGLERRESVPFEPFRLSIPL